jgi:hypothetical protein
MTQRRGLGQEPREPWKCFQIDDQLNGAQRWEWAKRVVVIREKERAGALGEREMEDVQVVRVQQR